MLGCTTALRSCVLSRLVLLTSLLLGVFAHNIPTPQHDRLAIIGAAGYIGSRLQQYLEETTGWQIVGYDRALPSFVEPHLIHKAAANISKEELSTFTTVIYLGGLTGRVACASETLARVYEENIVDILQLAGKMHGDQLLIFASTAALAEGSFDPPHTELSRVNPEAFDEYTWSMYMRELALEKLARTNQNAPRMVGLRFASVCGLSRNPRDLILNRFVHDALTEGRLQVTQPELRRGILWMEDLVAAIPQIISARRSLTAYDVFYLESFHGTVAGLANAVAATTHVPMLSTPSSGGLVGFAVDASKFARTFSFRFKGTLEGIIQELLSSTPRMLIAESTGLGHNDGHDHVCSNNSDVVQAHSCVVCGSTDMMPLIDLGDQPLANDFFPSKSESLKLERFPLRLQRCRRCHHSQLSHIVDRARLFRHYKYQSGTSNSLRQHFRWLAEKVINETTGSATNGTILEIACNDGSQLDHFVASGWKTFCVDPAENLAIISRARGHNVIVEEWGKDFVAELPAADNVDAIVAQNVLAHVSDPVQFMRACVRHMSERTKLYIQTSQCEMFQTGQFDTIYHEHVSFFTAHSFQQLAELSGLDIVNFEIVPIHGQSCLVTFQKHHRVDKPGAMYYRLSQEVQLGMTRDDFYFSYGARTKAIGRWIHVQLSSLSTAGYKLLAYGAAAKGVVLLHYLYGHADRQYEFEYIVDDAPLKQGTYVPGTTIPVRPASALSEHHSGESLAIMVFSWNFLEEIITKIRDKLRGTGINDVLLVVPFPKQQIMRLQLADITAVTVLAERKEPLGLLLPMLSPQNIPKVVLISHFYNEELLLPFWIRHHAGMFDLAILIDYASTDRSVEIIQREAPPTWRVVKSRNANFKAVAVDEEVMDYEAMFPNAWKIALTTTEFLVHPNLHRLVEDAKERSIGAWRFRSINMVGDDQSALLPDVPLLLQRTMYSHPLTKPHQFASGGPSPRYLHAFLRGEYSVGRHGMTPPANTFISWADGFIAKFRFTPWPQVLPRMLQIAKRIPADDPLSSYGVHHFWTEQELHSLREEARFVSLDLREACLHELDFVHVLHASWSEAMQQPTRFLPKCDKAFKDVTVTFGFEVTINDELLVVNTPSIWAEEVWKVQQGSEAWSTVPFCNVRQDELYGVSPCWFLSNTLLLTHS